MGIKLKKSENKTFIEHLTSKWLRITAMLMACVMTGLLALQFILMNENQVKEYNNYDYNKSDEYHTGVYEMYERLCILSAVYLSSVDDNWDYQGSKYLLSDFLYYLDFNKYEYKKTDEGIIPVSDMFDYYVSFTQNEHDENDSSENSDKTESKADKTAAKDKSNSSSNISSSAGTSNRNSSEKKTRYITNIDDVEVPDDYDEEARLALYKSKFKNYIVRRHNQIISSEVSSGTIKTYYYPTDSAKYVDGEYYDCMYYEDDNADLGYDEGWTQETYADNLVPLGNWYYDNYGRYIYNFGNAAPILFFDFDKNTDYAENVRSGYVEVKEDTNDYIKGDMCRIEYAPDYKTVNGNTYSITVFISPKDSIIAQKSAAYLQKVDAARKTRVLLCLFSIVDFICIVYLVCVYGYKNPENDGEKCWSKTPILGKIYTEVYLLAAIVIFTVSVILFGFFYNSFVKKDLDKVVAAASISMMFAAGMLCVLEIISKFKTKSFFVDSFAVYLLKKIKTLVKSSHLYGLYISRPVGERMSTYSHTVIVIIIFSIFAAILSIMSGDPLLLLIAGATELAAALFGEFRTAKYGREFNKLSRKIDCLAKNEKFEDKIDDNSPFYSEVCNLDKISDTVKNSVESRIQSERMKIDLVANVSHDLKTPLTSIISYIDLMKKLDLDDEAKAYLQILDKKSQKLKNIVSDVFTLAKATSGVEVNLEKLDFVMLFNQALADMDDKIQNCGKTVKINVTETSAMIMGDGSKLYRVFQNLIDNMINYSMNGTRLFMDVYKEGDSIVFSTKNVSSVPISYTAEEISERFVRGDKSRTDGGSGLGISIAKSFVEACGGIFKIELDGDMFKTTVKMPIIIEEDLSEQDTKEKQV